MSDGPPGDDADDGAVDPFSQLGGLPFLGDMMRALTGQGPLNWDAARQFAHLGATGGAAEHNVEPALRPAYAELAKIAQLHVADVCGADALHPAMADPELVTRSDWANRTLEEYRPLFTELATSLTAPTENADPSTDPMMQMMAGLNRMLAPAMLGMAVGSMVGTLAQRVFGTQDLPIPRQRPGVLLIPANIEQFAQTWEIPSEQMRLWVLAHELAGGLLMSAGGVQTRLIRLVRSHVGAFRPDPDAVAEQLGSMDLGAGDPMAALQAAFSDPALLLGAVNSPEQIALQPELDAAVAAVVGFTDWVVDAVAARVIGGEALRIAEAVRRSRLETSAEEVFVERLLGIGLGAEQVARGKAFVQGAVDRAGDDALSLLLSAADPLPTPNEIDAPGLWLARVSAA